MTMGLRKLVASYNLSMLTNLKGIKGPVIKVVVFQTDVSRLLPSLDRFIIRDP